MAGMNNMTAEIAAADSPQYQNIRLFTVGQGTHSDTPLQKLGSITHTWTSASSAVVGGTAWKEFSAVCWLFGRQVHDALGVPVGLISSNWGKQHCNQHSTGVSSASVMSVGIWIAALVLVLANT
jgi:sialate O-acetylesterase